jgi:23S rRNA pseudouridine1911/1915/1917 synthase
MRLDQALAALVPGLSRSYLKQLVEAGAARRGSQIMLKPSRIVCAGERWTLELRPTAQSQAFQAQAMPLDIRYSDEHLLVVNKAAGMVVHPAPGNWSGTLLNGLLALDERSRALPRAGIVHRLDKDTSGLMVVARSRIAMDSLTTMIAARSLNREYLALAHRPWSGARTRRFEQPIGRDPRNRLRMAVVDLARNPGKPALTDVTLLQQAADGCLLHCKLFTGRTHQIRVHLAFAGHPLVADALYGGARVAGLERQALHAWRLSFAHPVNSQPLAFQMDPTEDFLQGLAQWGLGYNPAKWLEEPAP